MLSIDPYTQQLEKRLQPPGFEHLLGTDFFGRDIGARILLAMSNSLLLSVLSVAGAVCLGLGAAILAASAGSLWIRLAELCVDALLTMPVFLLCLVIVSWSGSGKTVIVLGQFAAFVPLVFRVCIQEITAQFRMDYIKIAQELGQSKAGIIVRHIFPFLLPKLYQQMISLISISIGIEAGLSYLGFGIPKPEPSLGNLLYDARNYITILPWYILSVLLSISLLLFIILLIAKTETVETNSSL